MIFDEMLKDLVNSVPGGIAATIMGRDGLPVRTFRNDDGGFDIQTTGVEVGPFFFGISRLQLGNPEEMVVTTDQVSLVCHKLTDEFFLCLLVAIGGNPWKGKFKARMLAPAIRKEL